MPLLNPPVAIGAALAVTLTAGGLTVAANATGVAPLHRPLTTLRDTRDPAVQTARTQPPSRSTKRASMPVVRVRPLRHLHTPDVLLSLRRPVTQAQIARLRSYQGVTGTAVLDVGAVRTAAGLRKVVGVDPSEFRSFTPSLTARSDPLWQSVARGELTLSFSSAGRLRNSLGKTLHVLAPVRPAAIRLGAFATLGLPETDAVVSHAQARALRLSPGHSVLLAAPRVTLSRLDAIAHEVFGDNVSVRRLRPEEFDQSLISDYAASVIPAGYLRLYRAAAATCPGLPWTVLAAIGAVETGHGSDLSTSYAGAMGPMQFLPSTFRLYGVDGNGDGVADIMNPDDAVYSAARYLCASGAGRGGQALYDAIFAYNHADWYVRQVLALAVRYQ